MKIIERPKNLTVIAPADWVPGPKQGEWTYSHYAALPEDGQRYEVIDGVLYYMTPAPSVWHQKVALRIARFLSTYVEDAGLGQVFIAPVDVELAPKSVVQPDVFVLLNASLSKITPERIQGAPDLVVEVSSPSTVGYDRRDKQDTYAMAGVPEYWIVDPNAHTVEILTLKDKVYTSLGFFRDENTLLSPIVPSLKAIRAEQIFA